MSPDPDNLAPTLSDKIRARHCDRQAVVYVRQSTLRQIEHNRESTRLQYALTDRACQLGWRPEQIVVIDDDLGRSAASALDRPGFQRLVAEVGFGHIGLVLGIEVSRLARSCRDWHQRLEMCALFDTLIGDADGIDDPSLYNDRLLLGLKGTMSEAEIHILKARMLEGRRAKAQRGELVLGLPRGYVFKPSGEVALDPDEEVQEIIRLVFVLFERRRSVSGVLRYLVDHDIRLPDRIRRGPHKGDGHWTRPNGQTLRDMLRNPLYAGAYVAGAGMPAACAGPASRTAANASCAIQRPGRCCTEARVRPTLIGTPLSGTRSRWQPTAPVTPAFPAAAPRCLAD
jgi:DNA invertase Pin-like site-specific DNA recombinase